MLALKPVPEKKAARHNALNTGKNDELSITGRIFKTQRDLTGKDSFFY